MQEKNETQHNIHNPARYEGESQEDYKNRRNLSAMLVKKNSQAGNGGTSTRKYERDEFRTKGEMKYIAGGFSLALRNWITQSNLAKLANKEV